MNTNELFEEIRRITLANLELVNNKLIHLTQDQISWRPSELAWNIQEVIAHLNEFSKYYYPTFESKISKTKFREPSDVFVSSPLGRSAWKSMKLGNARNVKRKFKALRIYNPRLDTSLISGEDVKTIAFDCEKFLMIIEKANQVSLRRVKIPVSFSKIIRLRLGDALLFVTYHNERHFQQIQNILNQKGFPKA